MNRKHLLSSLLLCGRVPSSTIFLPSLFYFSIPEMTFFFLNQYLFLKIKMIKKIDEMEDQKKKKKIDEKKDLLREGIILSSLVREIVVLIVIT
jgi:hypothetical protein